MIDLQVCSQMCTGDWCAAMCALMIDVQVCSQVCTDDWCAGVQQGVQQCSCAARCALMTGVQVCSKVYSNAAVQPGVH